MMWNGVKPSRVYGRRAGVEKALRGSGWKIEDFRLPQDGDLILYKSPDTGALRPGVRVDLRTYYADQPRFILVPGEFATWWE
jgi:hypothetical protein